MQVPLANAYSVYRIVFKRGSPQRMEFTSGRFLAAFAGYIVLIVACQLFFFGSDPLQSGLFLFASLVWLWVGAALLSRKAPRNRLRLSLLAVVMIGTYAALVLLLTAPLMGYAPHGARYVVAALVAIAVLLGVSNCVQFTLAASRASAVTATVLSALAVTVFYVTLTSLFQVVFS